MLPLLLPSIITLSAPFNLTTAVPVNEPVIVGVVDAAGLIVIVYVPPEYETAFKEAVAVSVVPPD